MTCLLYVSLQRQSHPTADAGCDLGKVPLLFIKPREVPHRGDWGSANPHANSIGTGASITNILLSCDFSLLLVLTGC